MSASYSKLDTVYRSFLLSKFFTKGWGNPNNIKRLFEFRRVISDREKCMKLVPDDYPIHIKEIENNSHYKLYEGHFTSPFVNYLPEVVPKECATARFQLLTPTHWQNKSIRPLCIHLAGTGDHYFWRRRTLMAKPLLKEAGIASIILENPFYGTRKPEIQHKSCLHNVSDIFVMGGCLVLECQALLRWCEKMGYGPFALTGISMGGHMASIAGCNWNKPIAIVPCLSWTTASCAFTQGVMSGAIPWNLLQSQYFSDHIYKEEILKMVHSPEESFSFLAGYHFSSNYPTSLKEIESKSKETKNSSAKIANKPTSSAINNEYSYLKSLTSSFAPNFDRMRAVIPNLIFAQNNSFENAEHKLQKEYIKREALNFMRGIMDECTHLGNFAVPVDPSLSIIVAAVNDAYIPRDGIKPLQDLWPGSEVRYLDCGHIAAFLFNQSMFRKAIIDALDKTTQKYYQHSLKHIESA